MNTLTKTSLPLCLALLLQAAPTVAAGLDAITCSKTLEALRFPAVRENRGEMTIPFEQADCSGGYPDGDYFGAVQTLRLCSGYSGFDVRADPPRLIMSDAFGGCRTPSTVAVIYIRYR